MNGLYFLLWKVERTIANFSDSFACLKQECLKGEECVCNIGPFLRDIVFGMMALILRRLEDHMHSWFFALLSDQEFKHTRTQSQ